MTPLDDLAIETLADRLRQISVASGYRTDAGEAVCIEEPKDYASRNDIVLMLVDVEESLLEQRTTRRKARLHLVVALLLPKGIEAPRKVCRHVFADVRDAIAAQPQELVGSGAVKLELGGRRLPRREEGSNYLIGELDLFLEFVEHHRSTP